MKKILLALAIGTASLVGLSSCTKEYVTNYLPGVSYYEPLASGDWTRNERNNFTAIIPVPELDQQYYEDGEVSVAIQFEDQKGTFHNIPSEGINGHGYNASYKIGEVILYAVDLDNLNEAPKAMRVKIVLTDAEIGN
ncbi:hypothetical protein ACFQ2C_09520 [Sphingobacterium daejeonense]|jgi:hypothetical protein|uniref:DUF1735 domain-containing protein n=1 Tax=Sphingobacterium daejeonense TaxID=371142 RepID=A0ABW3RKU6_9SPHI|nr:hypothetical protein [Sphingobacterium sp. 1.A.5]